MTAASNRPLRGDIDARAARERVELAAAQRDGTLAIEACDMLAELFRAGYRVSALGDPAAITARPVKMRARYEGLCAACGAPIAIDDPIYWTRGQQGIECSACGGAS